MKCDNCDVSLNGYVKYYYNDKYYCENCMDLILKEIKKEAYTECEIPDNGIDRKEDL